MTDQVADLETRSADLLRSNLDRVYRRTDRIFLYLMPLEWVVGIVLAWVYSPRVWVGTESSVHVHLWAAVLLGGAATLVPAALTLRAPGAQWTRLAVGIGQGVFCGLFIHLSGGRIESHFFIFGSLAFLAAYRDWRVLVLGSAIVAVDHLLRGVWFPQSLFGVVAMTPWRIVEHAAYVIFEDVVLLITTAQAMTEMRASARVTAQAGVLADQLEQEKAASAERVRGAVRESLQQRVGQALAGIQDISSGVARTAETSRTMAERARRSEDLATGGAQVMELAKGSIRSLVDDVRSTLEVVDSLDKSSQEIGEVTNLIQKVAFQTNLLALNAAVESARAGEHGRGFAVVADEVRALAGNTATAADTIKTIVETIQATVKQVGERMTASAKRADQSIDQVHHADNSLREIEKSVGEIASLLDDLVATTQQQTARGKELADDVRAMTGADS